MPKKKTKKIRKPITVQRLIMMAIVAVVLVAVAAQMVVDATLVRQSRQHEFSTIKTLIVEAVKNLHAPAPIDAQSGKIYLYSARVVLPPPPNSLRSVLYNYVQDDENKPVQSIGLTTQALISYGSVQVYKEEDIGKIFANVPQLQSCSRGVSIVFDSPWVEPGDGVVIVGHKQLTDGRTAYVYKETKCSSDIDPLAVYAMQVQSY